MRVSRGAMVGIVGLPTGEHGPEHVGAPAREGDDGLGVVLPLAPLAVVVGPALRVDGAGAEGALVEDALEVLVAPPRVAEGAGAPGLAQHGREAGRGGEGRGGAEAGGGGRHGGAVG